MQAGRQAKSFAARQAKCFAGRQAKYFAGKQISTGKQTEFSRQANIVQQAG